MSGKFNPQAMFVKRAEERERIKRAQKKKAEKEAAEQKKEAAAEAAAQKRIERAEAAEQKRAEQAQKKIERAEAAEQKRQAAEQKKEAAAQKREAAEKEKADQAQKKAEQYAQEQALDAEQMRRDIMERLQHRTDIIRDKLGAELDKPEPDQEYIRVLEELDRSMSRLCKFKDPQNAPLAVTEAEHEKWVHDLIERVSQKLQESAERIRQFEDSGFAKRMQQRKAANAAKRAEDMYDKVYESYFKAYGEVSKMQQKADELSKSEDDKDAEYARRFDSTLKNLDGLLEEAGSDRDQERSDLVENHLGNIEKLLEKAKTWAEASQLWSRCSDGEQMYKMVYDSYLKAHGEVSEMQQMANELSKLGEDKYAGYAHLFDSTLKKLDGQANKASGDSEQEQPDPGDWNLKLGNHLGNIEKLLEEAKTWAEESRLLSRYRSVMHHQENASQESPPSQGGAAVAHSQLVQAHPILQHRTTVELLLFKQTFCLRYPVQPPGVAEEALALESIDYDGQPVDANDNAIGLLVFVWLCRQFHCLEPEKAKTEAAAWLDQQLHLSGPQDHSADEADATAVVVPEFFKESSAPLQRVGCYTRRNPTIPIDSTDLLMEMVAPRKLQTAEWTNCTESIGTREDMLNACWKLLDARSHRILFALLTSKVAKKMREECEPNLAIFNSGNHWSAFPPGVQAAILQALWNDLLLHQSAAKSYLNGDERKFLEAAIASPLHFTSDPTEAGTSLPPAHRVVELLKQRRRRRVIDRLKANSWFVENIASNAKARAEARAKAPRRLRGAGAPPHGGNVWRAGQNRKRPRATLFEDLNFETLFDARSTLPEQRAAVATCLSTTLKVTALKHCIAELNTVLKDHQFLDLPMPTTKKTKADCIEYIVCRLFDSSISADQRSDIFKRLQLKVQQMKVQSKQRTEARFWDLAAQL